MDKGESNGSGRRCGRVAPKRDTDDFKRYSRRPERSTRIDWVDYAKGICIVMVVMMHSVLGRGKGGRRHRFHACVRHVRAAVPDAGFLPDFRACFSPS
jgi:hypothetical protein